MRANYGLPLRNYLKRFDIREIIDFGDLPLFQTATTYPCIICIKMILPSNEMIAVNMDSLDFSG
jgi:hypothetical protein